MKKLLFKTLKISVITLIAVASLGGIRHFYLEAKKAKATQVEELMKNAAVSITLCGKRGCGGGSGFVIRQTDRGSYIVSNKHVCDVAKIPGDGVYDFNLVRVFKRTGQSDVGQILRVASNSDLCLIFTRMKFKATLSLANSYKIGQLVQAYGFPQGGPTLVKGVIKSVGPRYIGIYSESNMLAWYGLSGSAVVDKDGRVVGVMSNLLTDKPRDRKSVYGSLFVPLEVLQDFLGGI